jgi:hypothetical protein
VSTGEREGICPNCHRRYPAADLDQVGWCDRCRAVVIRRATLTGRLAGIIGSLAVGYWIFGVLNPDDRFLMVWLLVVAVVYGFLYKIVQRVSFEIIRSRGVPPPREA